MNAGTDPNEGRAVRLALARRLAPVYAAGDGCAAVIVGGSVARGWSDGHSDLELGMFWRAIPAEDERRRLAVRAGARDVRVFRPGLDTGMANEDCTVDGLKIDLVHAAIDTIDTILDDVVNRYDPTLWKHEVVSTLLSAIPLVGAELLATWQSWITYPRELARIMIRENMVFGPRVFLETLARRGDFLLLRTLLGRIERQLLGILLALNRVFTPSWTGKWTPRIVDLLTVKPPDFLERARRVWFLPDSAAIAEAHALIEETLGLVDELYPEVDTRPARARIAARAGAG